MNKTVCVAHFAQLNLGRNSECFVCTLELENLRLRRRSEWLLHNGGLLHTWACEWRPQSDRRTLIQYLTDKVDDALGRTWDAPA
jgi:hypothetical protein